MCSILITETLGNIQIRVYDILGGGVLKTISVPSYGGRGLAKSSYNFYSGWKSFFTVPLALLLKKHHMIFKRSPSALRINVHNCKPKIKILMLTCWWSCGLFV